MLQERYNHSNKEIVLGSISAQDFDDSKHFSIYETEIVAISNNETYADFLAIAPWDKIPKLVRIVLVSLEKFERKKFNQIDIDQFCLDTTKKIDDWCQNIHYKLDRVNTSYTLKENLLNSRSLISSIQGLNNLEKICKTIILCDNAGAVPQKSDNPLFCNFQGHLLPFHTADI